MVVVLTVIRVPHLVLRVRPVALVVARVVLPDLAMARPLVVEQVAPDRVVPLVHHLQVVVPLVHLSLVDQELLMLTLSEQVVVQMAVALVVTVVRER